MNKHFIGLVPLFLLSAPFSALASIPIDLDHRPASFLIKESALQPALKVKEVSRDTDFNQTLHVRIKQTYQGYPVWGGDGVVHIPHAGNTNMALTNLILAKAISSAATMNGTIYKDLNVDLASATAYVFNQLQADKAIQQAVVAYQQKIGTKPEVKNQKSQLMVYIDQDNKAHWAFQIQFDAPPVKANAIPERPIYIMDAQSFQVYEQWNDIKTMDDAFGGGFGGNEKMGKFVYDGLSNHLSKLNIQRDVAANICYLKNADVTVRDRRHNDEIMKYNCSTSDSQHNNVYWNGDQDAIHHAYSPSNDALYTGAIIKDMYQKWYKLPVLTKDGKPMMLTMVVHESMDNAYWDGKQMTFGDGIYMFYPLTSLGVAAHEISHGFTEQHSGLVYAGQSGGMNEAFSDMAAQAAEFYAYGKNSWQIGPEIVWWGDALRYMDQPSKDCHGWPAGWGCSIDNASQYDFGIDVHHSSGVYNHLFYLLGTSPGWDTRKAFDVMVQANRNYWTTKSTFAQGACGVIKATKDYGYDTAAVTKAFSAVKIDTSQC